MRFKSNAFRDLRGHGVGVRTCIMAAAGFAGSLMLTSIGALAQGAPQLESAVKIESASPDWDYLSFDEKRGRLFIAARPDGLLVYDVRSQKLLERLGDTKGANASVPVPEVDRLYSVNLDGTVTIFELSSLKQVGKIKVGEDADAAFYDPVTKQIAVTRGDSSEITYLSAPSGEVVARLKLPSKKLEGTVADGRGHMFTASRDRNSVFKVDMRTHQLVAEYADVCEEANGAAIDTVRGRLFIGCRGKNPALAVVDIQTGGVVAKMEIGRGNDGVIYDAQTGRIYASGGVDGNLVVHQQIDANNYQLAAAVTTRPYARTMAFDPGSQKIYLVTAEGNADPKKKINKSAAPFYPNTYFANTFTVLTYTQQ